MADIVVVCMRDPDASNEFRVFGGNVKIVDVDYGYADLRNEDEFEDWAGAMEGQAADLELASWPKEAADFVRELVAEAREAFGHAAPK